MFLHVSYARAEAFSRKTRSPWEFRIMWNRSLYVSIQYRDVEGEVHWKEFHLSISVHAVKSCRNNSKQIKNVLEFTLNCFLIGHIFVSCIGN